MLPLNTIYNQDCLQGMKLIDDKSIDMILCDLPYGTTQNKWDSVIPLEPLWGQYQRIIKTNGAIVLFGFEPFSTSLRKSNMDIYRYDWIWVKNNSTGFQNANKQPMRKHEIISVFYKKQPTYNPQGLKPYGKTNKRNSFGNNWRSGTIGKDGEMRSNSYVQKYTNYPNSLLHYDKEQKQLHPTQKPVALCEYLIKTYTNEGDLVLDNCIGSGTTAVACINTNRQYIGFELSKEYCELAQKRMADEMAQVSLFYG